MRRQEWIRVAEITLESSERDKKRLSQSPFCFSEIQNGLRYVFIQQLLGVSEGVGIHAE
jgi:hypothetical protein